MPKRTRGESTAATVGSSTRSTRSNREDAQLEHVCADEDEGDNAATTRRKKAKKGKAKAVPKAALLARIQDLEQRLAAHTKGVATADVAGANNARFGAGKDGWDGGTRKGKGKWKGKGKATAAAAYANHEVHTESNNPYAKLVGHGRWLTLGIEVQDGQPTSLLGRIWLQPNAHAKTSTLPLPLPQTLAGISRGTAERLHAFNAAVTVTGASDDLKYAAAIKAFQKAQVERQRTGLESNVKKQGTGAAAGAVVAAHERALQHMLAAPRDQPLTSRLLCEVHAILCKDDAAAQPGQLRKISVKCGTQTFCPPGEVRQRLEETLAAANRLLLSSTAAPNTPTTATMATAAASAAVRDNDNDAARSGSGNSGTSGTSGAGGVGGGAAAATGETVRATDTPGEAEGKAAKVKLESMVTDSRSLAATHAITTTTAATTIPTTTATSPTTLAYVAGWPPELLGAVIVLGVLDVHPFTDGNGRLTRILLNWVLKRAGVPFVSATCHVPHTHARTHAHTHTRTPVSAHTTHHTPHTHRITLP